MSTGAANQIETAQEIALAVIFPEWTNRLPVVVLATGVVVAAALVGGFWYWSTDKHLVVGYRPRQPLDFSHKVHAGDVGMDCRYCHYNVERSAMAGVPPSEVCMNCHVQIRTESPEIAKLAGLHESGKPVPWIRVHKLPDYTYFNHSAHVNKGVACLECHGRVDQMPVVRHVAPLTMGWCLNCHRDPVPRLRARERMSQMALADTGQVDRSRWAKLYHVETRTDCSTCHR